MGARELADAPPARPSPGPTVERRRLLDRLMQARGGRCVVLQGPPGCGKTMLLLAWRRELVVAGTDVSWLALGPDDDDPARFLDALVAGLRDIDPVLVREATLLAGRGSGPRSTEAAVIALLRAIAARTRPLVLVLDDAHHLRTEGVVDALQLLLDYGPPHLLCALATRTPPPVALGRLRAQGQVLELGFEDLRFTQEESRQFVLQALGAPEERRARLLHERTEGWAAGLKLLCMDLRRPRGTGQLPREGVRDAHSFARYLEEEVLAHLDPADLAVLVRCAVPDHFDIALCAALAGEDARRSALLAQLEAQGLFVLPAGPRYPDGWLRMHPLLRDVLFARVEALPEAERAALHATAWHFFADRGMVYDAVRHALRAGAVEAAADIAQSCAVHLFTRGELRQLVTLVRQLPEAAVRGRPALQLWLAYAQLYEQRLDECAQSIAQLQVALAAAPPAERFRLTLLRALHALQRDDSSAAVALLPELLDAPPDADGIALMGRRGLLIWTYLYRGEYERARRVQLEEPPPLVDGQPLWGTPFGLLAARSLVGLTHAVEGQMIRAERIYRDVLYEAERRGAACADAAALAAGLLAEVLYELNDPAGVLALLEPRLDVLEQVAIPDTRLRVMLALGRSHWLHGRPLDALDALEQAEDQFERMGLDRPLAYSLLEQQHIRLLRGELQAARELLARIEAVDARHAGADTGAVSEIHVVAERARIRILMETGDLDEALARLGKLTALCDQRGRARRVPYLHLQAAAVQRQLGRHAAARALVRNALQQGESLGLMRTLLDAHPQVPSLLREALDDPQLDPVLALYAERLEAALREGVTPARPPAPAQPALDALSPREREIVQLLLQAQPNKKIARALGLSLDTVKWHLKNVYAKLGVTGRDGVVERYRS